MLSFSLILFSFCFVQINCVLREYRRLKTHYKCLNDYYPCTNEKIIRRNVANQEIKWTTRPFLPPYEPPAYTAKIVLDGPDWADPDMGAIWFQSKPQWNLNNGQSYSRQCGAHIYLVNNSYPLNPVGRTGLKGRGLLGRWGPNHAVNVVIARFRKDSEDMVVYDEDTNKPFVEILVVRRSDANLWAIPGRFLRVRERINIASKKCIIEEAFNKFMNFPDFKRRAILNKVNRLVMNGALVYLGYVDDPRNTDNAWVSSTVMLYFDKTHNLTINLDFEPGNNILEVKWINAEEVYDIEFYGNHADFVEDAVAYLDGFYPPFESQERKRKIEDERQAGNSSTSSESKS